MEFKHFLHKHNLSLTEVGKKNDSVRCHGCLDIIYGPAYSCNTCDEGKFVMHKSCAELPPQIQINAFHPHPLRFSLYEVIVCDGCAESLADFINYRCMDCTFNLDFRCALAISNDYKLADHLSLQEGKRIKITIHHFSHYHQLTRCTLKINDVMGPSEASWGSNEFKCMACKQELHGTLTYTCLPCRFVCHESCVNDMPSQVLHGPFHPQHILLPRPIRKGSSHRCSVCRGKLEGIGFYCNQCDVMLHVSCAKYRTRAIKHNCHPHYLLHLGKSIMSGIFCEACKEDCGDSFFSCIKCKFYIHAECIPLPPFSDQDTRHLHPLMLVNPFAEDDSGVYYCDACETERNPENHVYYCEECKYIAHIGCALSEVEATKEMFLDQQIDENPDKADIADKIMDSKSLELEGTLVHNKKKIQKDVFHRHPLTLEDDDENALFVCNGCGELCRGLSYNCSLCQFSLDSRCAVLDDHLAKHQLKKAREIQTTIYHFIHSHQLSRCNINILQTEIQVSCMTCRQDLYGLVYTCLLCQFFLHESCLKDLPMEVLQSPFHPQHSLPWFPIPRRFSLNCHTCGQRVQGIALFCSECEVFFHNSCANYKTRKIKHDCHGHDLLHLGKSIFVKASPRCDACHEDCRNTLFGCIQCRFFIHLECIPLPKVVKHIRHLHPLTLTNSVDEDDYCDMCETARNPKHDVYYCEECKYIAHIDCVISEVEPPEKIVEYLVPRPRKEGPQIRKQIDEDSDEEEFEEDSDTKEVVEE
ncbi:hypothetical protein PTKIN_Ptkin01aG0355100 [Pterospermum kingtungense]